MSRIKILDTEEMTAVDNTKSASGKKTPKPRLNVVLTVVQGSDIDFGKIYNFSCETIMIGRDKDNTITVEDRKVSKQHCEISLIKANELEQVLIKDLNSTNGTYVNGEPVDQRILNSGDKITLGETIFRFNFNDEIEEEYHSKLFNYAAIDSLTGLYNRRYISTELENQFKIAKRNNRIFSIAMLDIDDFKKINDSLGHQAGDEFLKHVAFCINHSLREQDICGRLGGEEFLIILPETDVNGAYQLSNRIRSRIESTELNYQCFTIKATISIGVAQCILDIPCTCECEDTFSPDVSRLYRMADNALYEAKKQGKNKVVSAPIPTIANR